jgi:hypothetical protein
MLGRQIGYYITDVETGILQCNTARCVAAHCIYTRLLMCGSLVGWLVGWLVNVDSATTSLESIYNSRKGSRKFKATTAKPQPILLAGSTDTDSLVGLHLYVCFNCKRVLIKPLQCGGCKCAAYCSRVCATTPMTTTTKVLTCTCCLLA